MGMRSWLVVALTALAVAGCSDDDDETAEPNGTGGGGGDGGAATDDTDVEVTAYHYGFDISTGQATSLLLSEVEPPGGNCTTLDCSIGLDDVTWNDAPATFQPTLLDARVCGDSLAAGATLDLASHQVVPEATFHGLDVGWSHQTNLAGGTFSYLLSWVGGCHHFGPCDADPSKLVAFDYEITHPAGTTALCPGVLTPGSTLSRCTVAGTLAPTYSAFFLAADTSWVRTPYATLSGVDIVLYEAPGGTLAANLDLLKVETFFGWLTGLLGPYPYGAELRIAGAPTQWLGFEHPGNIILHERLDELQLSYADGLHHVFFHEIIHQWAGARTTLASATDFVWKEAIAQYLPYVFEDEYLFQGEAAASLAYYDEASLFAEYFPRPMEEPAPDLWDFYGDAYGPGPMVLFVQLETMVGRGTVLQAIADFLSQPVARSVADLRTSLEQASGEDLGPYFDAWVFGTGAPSWPLLTATVDQVGDQVTVTLTQQSSSNQRFGFAVEVRVEGATTSALALVDFGLAPTTDSASTTVTLAEPVVSHVIDPHHRVINRTSNLAAKGPRPKIWIF